ncbi:MAG: family lipase [Massilia sp.]|nr:family lipase [Massilia sp.]
MKPYRQGRLAILILAMFGLGGCAALAPSAPADGGERWVASWGTALQAFGQAESLPADLWQDGTLRQVVRLSLGGTKLRVRVSNVHGTQMLVINEASIGRALRPGSSEVLAGTLQPLRFGGHAAVRIPAGSEYLSDPVDMTVARGLDVAVTLHLSGSPGQQTGHAGARTNSFLARGRHTNALALDGAQAVTRWHQLSDVEVSAAAPGPGSSPARALVVIGDSITDGYGATTDGNNRWTDHLVRRLARDGKQPVAVINAGIGGGRLLREGLGPSLASRFERDVVSRSGVSHAIVFIGVNDIGVLRRANEDTPAAIDAMLGDFKNAHMQMVARAHARGICVIGATITPFMGSGYYKPSAQIEAMRQAFNDWMRQSGVFDGVLDFDLALRDPARPGYLGKAWDSGDGLHPSHAGYAALAEAVPLASLDKCRYSPIPGLR